jgi:predicted KAP-like P-loop ATPase
MTLSNDAPISEPKDDLYNLDPFARAVARAIQNMKAPEGIVLAVNGPWGSGKSSAINLVRHHLKGVIDKGRIVPVAFNPWWFSGTDAITIAFFRELAGAVGRTLPDNIRLSIEKLGDSISTVGAVAGIALDIKAPGLGRLFSGITGAVPKMLSRRTVEQEHDAVVKALAAQERRFLVFIDDIDRLSPDDALTIFRLVKSVGRLPNVIYLLSFDRTLAEKTVIERFPSEGSTYLQKIVQGSFDIPLPPLDILRRHILMAAQTTMGEIPDSDAQRFMNVFFDAVAPFVSTPRDVIRIENELRATWPSVEGEVDRGDFLAISTIKLCNHSLYKAIRRHPDDLCDADERDAWGRQSGLAERYNTMLGLDAASENYELLRRALRRLFPRLEGVWGNVIYAGLDRHNAARNIASRQHFPTYFNYAIGADTLPAAEIEELLGHADDEGFVQTYLRKKLQEFRPDGSTQASLVLEELTIRAASVPVTKVGALVRAIFALADELDVESDRKRGFAVGDNELRIHWLINRLVTDRFQGEEREKVYTEALQTAAVGWLCDFTRRCISQAEPDKEKPSDPIVSAGVAEQYKALSVARLRAAAADGSLISNPRMTSLLLQWRNWTTTEEVHAWTNTTLENDGFVIALAKGMTSVGWAQGMGDRVATRIVRVQTDAFTDLVDLPRLDDRAGEVAARDHLSTDERAILTTFLSAQRGPH